MNKKGKLVVISGPSGAGKDTVCARYMEENNAWLSISMTSRLPRDGEVDGFNYFFVSDEEFEEYIKKDNFLEWAKYNNKYYGTPKNKINEYLDKGIDVILIIEVQGALQVQKLVKDAIFIFIMPPSINELKQRLINRNTETIEKIEERITIAHKEIELKDKYDYIVVNDDIDKAAKRIKDIIKEVKANN